VAGVSTPLSVRTQARAGVFTDLRQFGDHPALITADATLSFSELADRIDIAGEALTSERRLVLLAGTNEAETMVAYAAALAHGHAVLMVPGDSEVNLASMVEAYDPDVVFGTEGGFTERREGSRHDLHPDLALLMSTSGSTGSPKLVRLSHDNVTSNARSIAEYLDLDDDDRAITTLPMHYCYGLSVINSHLLSGAGLVVTDWSVVDPCLWDLFDRSEATSFAGVPYTFDLLDSSGFAERSLPSLRYVTQAGGRLAPERVAAYAGLGRERGWSFYTMYGQTEATARMAYLPPELAESHPHALGIPVPGGAFRLEVVPESTDGVGELVYRGDNVMMGYASVPDDLARGPELTELHTGDLAQVDDDGMYTWVGRRSRIAKVFGLRIDLDDIERALARGGVAARCVSVGDRLQAFVTWDQDAAVAREIMAVHCGLPGHVIAVDELAEQPRTATGKVDYAALERQARVLASSTSHSRRGAAAEAADVDRVRDLYAELLGRPDATPEDSFVTLGGDSLSYVELSVRLGELRLALSSDWHRTPIRELVEISAPRSTRGVRLETSILLRAVAIVLIVGSHANLWLAPGGAHVLLGVVGFNFARFVLTDRPRRERVRSGLSSLVSLVVPCVIWIGLVATVLGSYDTSTVFFLNGALGSDSWTEQWQFWFLEAIIWTQVAVLLVLTVPLVHRLECRAPFAMAMAVLAGALALRFTLVGVEAGPTERYTPSIVLWLFALGWAASAASRMWQRLVVSVLLIAGTVGFFDDPQREAIVVVGLLLLVWVSAVTVPRWFSKATGVLAAASLYIYLTHWQVYPHLEMKVPLLAMLSSLAVGIGYRHLSEMLRAQVRRGRKGMLATIRRS